MMGVTSVTGSDAGDGKRKAKGDPSGVSVRAETDFPTSEQIPVLKSWVVARFPSPPDSLWSLPGVHIASPLHPVTPVFFVPAMDAVSAD